jgi:hypothetical protein
LIEDFTTTIKAQLYERVSSPLLSSFVISWCGWNYKFLLVIFSSISTHEKLIYIDLNIFPDIGSKIIYGALLPLLTSLFLIFIYPTPAEVIYKHVKTNQRRLKEIQQSIDDESPLSKEQARKIRREALENQLKYEAEIDSKTSENSRLKELISELQQRIASTAEPPKVTEASEINDKGGERSLTDLAVESANSRDGARTGTLDSSVKSAIDADHADFHTESTEIYSASQLDRFMRENIFNYIAGLKSFSDLDFNVIAKKGKLIVLLSRSNGSYFPYISAEYTPNTAPNVLESLKSALVNDHPPAKGD